MMVTFFNRVVVVGLVLFATSCQLPTVGEATDEPLPQKVVIPKASSEEAQVDDLVSVLIKCNPEFTGKRAEAIIRIIRSQGRRIESVLCIGTHSIFIGTEKEGK